MSHIDFRAIVISGVDALNFLQGQLTCDVRQIEASCRLGAYCDNKGRVLANFWIARKDEAYYLYVPQSMCEQVITTLKKYAVFSKVSITEQPAMMGEYGVDTQRLHYIHQGMAFIFPQTSLLFTPQMIRWEKWGGVSFDKGCYLGQEIVARTQHLGQLKRHLHLFKQVLQRPAQPGDPLLNAHQEVMGIVCDVAFEKEGLVGLAVIQDQALTIPLFLNGQPVEIVD